MYCIFFRVIDLTDAILVLMVLAGMTPDGINNFDADVDRNGLLDMRDVLFIMQWVSGKR